MKWESTLVAKSDYLWSKAALPDIWMVCVCDSVQGNWTQLRYEWHEGEYAIEITMPIYL